MSSEAKLLRTFFWRRLDQPGHDLRRLFRTSDGWRLAGVAVLLESPRAYDLAYEVAVDEHWNNRSASVTGHCGKRLVALRFPLAMATPGKRGKVKRS